MQGNMNSLQKTALEARELLLKAANHIGAGHVGGSLSEIEILTALYFSVMHVDPQNPAWEDRDRFILSKGHASLGLYSVLSLRGYFGTDEMMTFDATGTRLQAHPDMHKCPGIDYSSGSLGQGLSIGIGMATGAQMRGKTFKTFVLIGDGESQEGQVWEALMYAGAKRVKNLIAIFDYNHVQLSGTTEGSVALDPLPDKLKAFNWTVYETDGHDIGAVDNVLGKAYTASSDGPVAVIANTVKGKGISFMENKCEWHGKAPNDEQLKAALEELEGGTKK
jgi:transketolase